MDKPRAYFPMLFTLSAMLIAIGGCGGSSSSSSGGFYAPCSGKKADFSGIWRGWVDSGKYTKEGKVAQYFRVTAELQQSGGHVEGFVAVKPCVDRIPVSGNVEGHCLDVEGEQGKQGVTLGVGPVLWRLAFFSDKSGCPTSYGPKMQAADFRRID